MVTIVSSGAKLVSKSEIFTVTELHIDEKHTHTLWTIWARFYTIGESRTTQREPMQTQGEYENGENMPGDETLKTLRGESANHHTTVCPSPTFCTCDINIFQYKCFFPVQFNVD